jgi:hypothetical protein
MAERQYSDRAGYLREYMRGHMAHRAAGYARSSGHPRMLLSSGYDVGQKELRDGSGTLMWPTRIRDSLTPYSDGLREIDAGGKRRRNGPVSQTPRPAVRPPRQPAHYGPKKKIAIEPRKFERRASA